MPTYEYVCRDCGTHVEVHQRFSDDPLTVCGVCGGELRKVFHPAGILFKGTGFYATDSRRSSSSKTSSSEKTESGSTSDATSSTSDTASTPSKSAAASGDSGGSGGSGDSGGSGGSGGSAPITKEKSA